MKKQIQSYRTVVISDVHLGARSCKAEYLIDFLEHTQCENLILAGDIIDGWSLKRKVFWPQVHNTVVQKVFKKANKGTNVIYIIGNHDEFLRHYLDYGLQLGNITILNEYIHLGATGKKYLVCHGDQYDSVILYAKWLAFLGDLGYDFLIWINDKLNVIRRVLHLPYWSLSQTVKSKVKKAVNFVTDFKQALVHQAEKRHLDGVICGHIHVPELEYINNIMYGNSGDWTENLSALVEHQDGTWEIVTWGRVQHKQEIGK